MFRIPKNREDAEFEIGRPEVQTTVAPPARTKEEERSLDLFGCCGFFVMWDAVLKTKHLKTVIPSGVPRAFSCLRVLEARDKRGRPGPDRAPGSTASRAREINSRAGEESTK
jgi:hypothetical protein